MSTGNKLFNRVFLFRTMLVMGLVLLLSGAINFLYPQQVDFYTLKVIKSYRNIEKEERKEIEEMIKLIFQSIVKTLKNKNQMEENIS